MTLDTRISWLVTTIATTVKNLKVKQGDLTTLTTTEKNTLVWAINELKSSLWILDSDVTTRINTAIANALEGEDLSDLADQILALVQADQWLVSATAVQSFTDPQKTQARNNIGAVASSDIWNTDNDYVTIFNNIYNA